VSQGIRFFQKVVQRAPLYSELSQREIENISSYVGIYQYVVDKCIQVVQKECVKHKSLFEILPGEVRFCLWVEVIIHYQILVSAVPRQRAKSGELIRKRSRADLLTQYSIGKFSYVAFEEQLRNSVEVSRRCKIRDQRLVA